MCCVVYVYICTYVYTMYGVFKENMNKSNKYKGTLRSYG